MIGISTKIKIPINNNAIEKISNRHSIDSRLVKAIVKVESDFNPNAVSKKGAKGLMQLMPETANDLNVSDPFNPYESIDGGVRYFKRLMKSFDNDLKLSLAAYNAGPGNVDKYDGVPPFKETQAYVKKVQRYNDVYNEKDNF